MQYSFSSILHSCPYITVLPRGGWYPPRWSTVVKSLTGMSISYSSYLK